MFATVINDSHMSSTSLSTLAKEHQRSIVRIIARYKDRTTVGTGFFIDKKRIITCAHVLLDAGNTQEILKKYPSKKPDEAVRARLDEMKTLRIERSDGSRIRIQAHCHIDPAFDVVIFHATTQGEALNIHPQKMKIGEDIFMLGFPEAIQTHQTHFPYSAAKGYVMSYPTVQIGGYTKRPMMQIFCSSLGGASGSPLFSEEGKVIGMLNGQMHWGADNFVFMEKDEKDADIFKKDFLYVPLPIGFATTGIVLLNKLKTLTKCTLKKTAL